MARPRFGRRRLAAETLYADREIGAPGNANLLIGRSPQQETTTKARARSRHLSPDTRLWERGLENPRSPGSKPKISLAYFALFAVCHCIERTGSRIGLRNFSSNGNGRFFNIGGAE